VFSHDHPLWVSNLPVVPQDSLSRPCSRIDAGCLAIAFFHGNLSDFVLRSLLGSIHVIIVEIACGLDVAAGVDAAYR